MKKLISINYGSSISCWKPWTWVRPDLILLIRNIYINSNLNPFTKFTSSSRSTKFKEIISWNISQMITKTVSISTLTAWITSCWKPWRWVRLHLKILMRNIYINSNLNQLRKFTSSSRSTKFIEIIPWNISQMMMKTASISTRIVVSYVMKQSILLWIWWNVNGNWDNNMIRISQWRKSYCRTNTSIKIKK